MQDSWGFFISEDFAKKKILLNFSAQPSAISALFEQALTLSVFLSNFSVLELFLPDAEVERFLRCFESFVSAQMSAFLGIKKTLKISSKTPNIKCFLAFFGVFELISSAYSGFFFLGWIFSDVIFISEDDKGVFVWDSWNLL